MLSNLCKQHIYSICQISGNHGNTQVHQQVRVEIFHDTSESEDM